MAHVSISELLHGSWYALEQCGLQLSQAAGHYQADQIAAAVAEGLFAAEELGKYHILRELWKSRSKVQADQVRKALKSHPEKQWRALAGSVTGGVAADTEIGSLLAMLGAIPWADPFKKREEIGRKLSKAMTLAREQALYVDVHSSGTAWHRPVVAFKKDLASLIIIQTGNNYSREKADPALINAVQTWADRPSLPEVPKIDPY